MKTTNNKTNSFSRLKMFFVMGILGLISQAAMAQCTAGFTFVVDPSNNGDVNFTNTSAGGTTPHCEWDFGDGTFSTAYNPGTHTYPASGAYNVILYFYSDSLGSCLDTIFQVISVINSSPAGGGCTASFAPFDSLGYVYFWNNSTSSAAVTSTWDFGDGTSGSSSGDTYHAYPATGTYYVCLTISNTFIGCSNTYCDSVVVRSSPGCAAHFYTTITGSSVQFNDYSSAPTGGSYFWDFGDGSNSSTVGTTSHTYVDGTYTACLTIASSDSSCYNTYCETFTISTGTPSCYAGFVLVQDSLNIYNYFAYNTSSSGAMYSYLWDFGDGTTSNLQYPSHTYPGSGPYYLCLTVSDGAACTATHCDTLTAGMAMSSSLTLNVLPTGVNEINTISTFENYPNPFSDQTTIHYNITQDASVELEVMDLLGNRVDLISNEHQQAGEHTLVYSGDKLDNGIYLMRLHVNGNTSTKKLILNK